MGEGETPIYTNPVADPAPLLDPRRMVTWLHEYRKPAPFDPEKPEIEIAMPASRSELLVGCSRTAGCDVVVKNRGLGKAQFVFARTTDGAVVRAHPGSTNGIGANEHRQPVIQLVPGARFIAYAYPDDLEFVALSEAMVRERPTLVELYGTTGERRVDDLMVEALGDAPILVCGDPSCEPVRLASALHRISYRPANEAVIVEAPREGTAARPAADLVRATGSSTLIVNIGADPTALEPNFRIMLFSASYPLRTILVADSFDVARSALGPFERRVAAPWLLRPITRRPGDLLVLVDLELALRPNVEWRARDLTPENQRALRDYSFKRRVREDGEGGEQSFRHVIGLAALRELVTWMCAVQAAPSLRDAAAALGIPRESFRSRWAATGLTEPLLRPESSAALLDTAK
ncbi:MAG TPA: hypothetical protein VGM88_11665 [Kofleriaceae bacterium]